MLVKKLSLAYGGKKPSSSSSSWCSDRVFTWEHALLALKLLVVVTCLSVTIWQAQVALERFLARDTSTILAVKPTGNETFLTMTVCPAFGSAYKEDVLNRFIKT